MRIQRIQKEDTKDTMTRYEGDSERIQRERLHSEATEDTERGYRRYRVRIQRIQREATEDTE